MGLLQSVFWVTKFMRWQRAVTYGTVPSNKRPSHDDLCPKQARTTRWSKRGQSLKEIPALATDALDSHGQPAEETLVQSLTRRLLGMGFHGVVVPGGTAMQSLKTLIVLVNKKPIAVVLPSDARISFSKVAKHMGKPYARVCLAPSQAVARMCGFPVGAVPPVGHFPELRTLVDSGTFSGEVGGGCGDPSQELLTTWADIEEASCCEIADLIEYDTGPGMGEARA